jgi:hypothetical protein
MIFSDSLDKRYGLGDLSLCKIKVYKNLYNWITCLDLDSLVLSKYLEIGSD